MLKAIEINAESRTKARKDEDFKEYWDDPDFLALTGED